MTLHDLLPSFATDVTVTVNTTVTHVATGTISGNVVTVATTSDGKMWRWSNGTPVEVTGVSDVASLRVGPTGAYVTDASGTTWDVTGTPFVVGQDIESWTDDGNDTFVLDANGALWLLHASESPTRVGPSTVTQFVSGASTRLAVDADGVLWGWGANGSSQIGAGMGATVTEPTRIDGPGPVVSVATSRGSVYVVDSSGDLWAWGNNSRAQNGTGSWTQSAGPTKIATGMSSVQASGDTAFALGSDGSTWVWGASDSGETGGLGSLSVPTRLNVPALTKIVFSSYTWGTSLFGLAEDGSVWAWGLNSQGQLGIGTSYSPSSPTKIKELSGVTELVSNGWSTYALADGNLWAWGYDNYGQTGESTSSSPVSLGAVEEFSVAGAEKAVMFALGSDHVLRGYGAGESGQMGGSTIRWANSADTGADKILCHQLTIEADSTTVDGEWTERTYTVTPGAHVTVTATFPRHIEDSVVVNQSWTSEATPLRPVTPDVEDVNVAGVAGNTTCNTDATSQTPEDLCDQVPAVVPGIGGDPSLSVTKTALTATPAGGWKEGASVTWNYVVTNTGNVSIDEIAVSDNRGVTVTCPASTLDAGASMTCTGTGNLTR